MSSNNGVNIYNTPLKGLYVSNHNFYLNQHLSENEIFIYFYWKNFRYYTTWPLELAISHSKESFHKWFSFNVKRRYKHALRNQNQL